MKMVIHAFHLSNREAGVGMGKETLFCLLIVYFHFIINLHVSYSKSMTIFKIEALTTNFYTSNYVDLNIFKTWQQPQKYQKSKTLPEYKELEHIHTFEVWESMSHLIPGKELKVWLDKYLFHYSGLSQKSSRNHSLTYQIRKNCRSSCTYRRSTRNR